MEKSWENTDRHLRALAQAPFRRKMEKVALSPGVTLIRGPRQIGKSTWLKLLLKEQMQKGHSCFYFSCEDLKDFTDLAELIHSQPRDIRYFFLDEVTFVTEWWRAIKKAVDTNDQLCFVLTGSNSYDLKKGVDLMPGRWSQGTHAGELYLLPMLFDEWCEMRRQAGWKDHSKIELLRGFMRVGGFPAALAETAGALTTPHQALLTYQRWILGDVVKLGKQEIFMRELIGRLATIMGSSISLQGMAQKTQLMSYHTVQDYISILESAFALRTLYAYDPETDTFRFKKQKKFYFSDPIIYWVALEWSGQKIPANFEEQLAEMIAAEQLYRHTKRLGYYSSAAGEVDFISQKDWAIEVKWTDAVTNVSKAYKNLKIFNKKIWHQNNFLE